MALTYELHPLCTLFPRMQGAEFEALVADIRENGQREPIILHDGMILDGGNRYRACIEAGVEPQFMKFGGGNIVAYVLSANLHRRHMTAGQQAAIVASAQDWAEAQPANRPKAGNLAGLSTVEDRAAKDGASERTQRMADKVAKLDPELAKKVAHGEMSLPDAVEKVTGKRPGAKRPKRELPQAPEPFDERDDLREAVKILSEENDTLRDRLAVESMPGTEDDKLQAQETIAELRARVKALEAENDALKVSRDGLMTKVAEMQRQVNYWRKRAEKVAA